MIRTESLPQLAQKERHPTREREVPAKKPVTGSSYTPAEPSMASDTSIRQRRTYEEKTADGIIASIFAHFSKLRKQAETRNIEPAVLCRLNRHGILGKLFSEHPVTAEALCKIRLADLKEDLKTFSNTANKITGRKDQAVAMLTEMEKTLNKAEEQPDRFLNLLAAYEKEFGKVSFTTTLDAHFMMVEGASHLALRTVIREGTLISVEDRVKELTAELGRNNVFEDGLNHEAVIAKAELIQLTPSSELTEEALLDVYIQNNPALVTGMIRSRAVNELLTTDSPASRDLARAVIDMEPSANKEPSAETISRLLETNKDLKNDVKVEISRLHLGRLFNELSAFNPENASVEALQAARHQCLVFTQLQKNFQGDLSTSEVRRQRAELEDRQIEISARMIHLYATAEANKPADQRLFWLNTPTTEQIRAKLATAELMESTEKTLYKNVMAYIDAREAFARTGNHQCLTTMQQARFDTLRSQQNQLVEEMETQIAGAPAATILGHAEYQSDMELLETIYQVRQTTAKYRPVETAGENVMRIGANIIWRDEFPLSDIKARLAHNRHLKQLDYNFTAEFRALCDNSPKTFEQVRSGLASIASKTVEGAKALLSSKTGLFKALGLSVEAYNSVQASLGETLKEMLEVAESNPVAFRRMCGDFAQLVPQMKLLVGANTELTNIIDQLNTRFSAEATAACFTGDKIQDPDRDIDPNSRLAKNLKRFQFFCDLSSGLLKGATGLNAIVSALNGPVGVARALFNVGTMVASREVVNRMPADEVKMLHRLFRYGPVACWHSTSPFEMAGRAARNIGQNKGLVTSVASAVFAPFINRYNALTEAIRNVYHHKPGAWAELAFEGAKAAAVVAATAGSTCMAAATIPVGGSLLATTGAVLNAGMAVSSFSYITAKLISYFENSNLFNRAAQGIEMFAAQYFAGNSQMAKSIRQKCETEAATIVSAIKKKEAYQQGIIEQTARALYREYWNQDFAKAHQSHQEEVSSFLRQTENERKEQATELAKRVEALQLIEKNLHHAGKISKNGEQLAELRKQLKGLGIDQRVPEAGLVHFLLNLKQELGTGLRRQCGTEQPGETPEEIAQTIAAFQKEVMLGSVIREWLALEKPDKITELTATVQNTHYQQLTGQMAKVEQQRIELMYTEALGQLIEDHKAEGQALTAADLKKMNLEAALKPRVERMYAELKSVNGQRIEEFKAQLEALPMVAGLCADTRRRVFSAAAAA